MELEAALTDALAAEWQRGYDAGREWKHAEDHAETQIDTLRREKDNPISQSWTMQMYAMEEAAQTALDAGVGLLMVHRADGTVAFQPNALVPPGEKWEMTESTQQWAPPGVVNPWT